MKAWINARYELGGNIQVTIGASDTYDNDRTIVTTVELTDESSIKSAQALLIPLTVGNRKKLDALRQQALDFEDDVIRGLASELDSILGEYENVLERMLKRMRLQAELLAVNEVNDGDTNLN